MPGDFSNEAAVTPGGAALAINTPEGFTQGVLGATTGESEEIKEENKETPAPDNTGNVGVALGVSAKETKEMGARESVVTSLKSWPVQLLLVLIFLLGGIKIFVKKSA